MGIDDNGQRVYYFGDKGSKLSFLEELPEFLLGHVLAFLNVGSMMVLGCVSKTMKARSIDSPAMWLLRTGLPTSCIHDWSSNNQINLNACKTLSLATEGVIACPDCGYHQENLNCMAAARNAITEFFNKEEENYAQRMKAYEEAQNSDVDSEMSNEEREATIRIKRQMRSHGRPQRYHTIASEGRNWDESMYIYARQHFGGGIEDNQIKFSQLRLCYQCGEVLNVPVTAFDPDTFFYEETPAESVSHPNNLRKWNKQEKKSQKLQSNYPKGMKRKKIFF